MHERIWMRSANSRSDNRNSKACTELSRSIRNPKWVGLLAIGVTLTMCGTVAQAQQAGKIPRVGVLFIGGRNQPHLESFKQGLKERGYTEGKNILLDYRYAEGNV